MSEHNCPLAPSMEYIEQKLDSLESKVDRNSAAVQAIKEQVNSTLFRAVVIATPILSAIASAIANAAMQ